MDKKPIYAVVTLSALALISYQTWKVLNKPENESLEKENKPIKELQNTTPVQIEQSANTLTGSKTYHVESDTNSISVKLTLDGKKITNMEIQHVHGGPISQSKHDLFDKTLNKGEIIGKDINSLNIANVTGATWTTNAFKDVIKELSTKLGS